MIIKVSHLVFSSNNFEENSRELGLLGYQCIFTETNLPNKEVKRPLFSHFSERHDLRYFSLSESVGVELLNWRHKSMQESNFVPLFQNIPSSFLNQYSVRNDLVPEQFKLGIFSFFKGVISTLHLPFFFLRREHSSAQLNGLFVKTSNLEESILFWKHFRFVVSEVNNDQAILILKSPLPQTPPFSLYLQKEKNINLNPHLDDFGVSCISFLSSDADKEKDLLKKIGITIFDVGHLLINQKLLKIFFALGPCGELIEVIDVKEATCK